MTYTRTRAIGRVYPDVHAELIAHGASSPHEEVGGLVILAPRRVGLHVVHWYPLDNIAREYVRHQVYVPDLARLYELVPSSLELWGLFHTHPTSDEQPSDVDRRSWAAGLACNLIYSVPTQRLAIYGTGWEPLELVESVLNPDD